MVFKVKDYTAMQEALAALCAFLEGEKVPKEKVFDAKLIACELMGNALKYAGGETGVESEVKDGYIELMIYAKRFFALPKKVVHNLPAGSHAHCVNMLCKRLQTLLEPRVHPFRSTVEKTVI